VARIRTIKPEFWRHPVIGRLPDDQQLLALALITMADDEGYFRAEAELIRGDVQPFREDLAKLSRGIAKLSEIGWIQIHDHAEQGRIGKITKWVEHQKVDHPKPSKLKGYFVREVLAKDSRSSREDFALEQGTGNREQGRGSESEAPPKPATETPTDIHPLGYASKIIEELGLTPSRNNNIIVADCLKAVIAKGEAATLAEAYEFLLAQAKIDQAEGVTIDKFYFEDTKWRKRLTATEQKKAKDADRYATARKNHEAHQEMLKRNGIVN
jgi:hypothetical protein